MPQRRFRAFMLPIQAMGGQSTDHEIEATPIATSGGAMSLVGIASPLDDEHANVAHLRSSLDNSAVQLRDRYALGLVLAYDGSTDRTVGAFVRTGAGDRAF